MGMAELIAQRRFDPRRITLRENFLQRPALNAVLLWPTPYEADNANAVQIANRDFEVSGTNMTTALCTFNVTGGGITLTTDGAANDQALLGTHTDTDASLWNDMEWDTSYEPSFECMVKLGSSLVQYTGVFGFKLTSTPVVATDNDQACFRFANTTTATNSWTFISSRSGTDVTTTARPEIAIPTASTVYRLRVDVLADRTVVASIGTGVQGNLVPVALSPLDALTADVNLLPFIGIQTTATGAKACSVYYVECGRLIR